MISPPTPHCGHPPAAPAASGNVAMRAVETVPLQIQLSAKFHAQILAALARDPRAPDKVLAEWLNHGMQRRRTKGADPVEWPEDLRVQQFPEGLTA